MHDERKLAQSLLLLRISVFVVMLMWTVDKLVRPDHAGGVFAGFYGVREVSGGVMVALGIGELILLGAFVAGLWKRWTYGAVMTLHAISTLAAFRQYLDPFSGPNLLFFAAWPMLAATIALYRLRDRDTITLTWARPEIAATGP